MPTQYDGSRLYPLIVLLHGSGGDENDVFDTTDSRKLAEARGAILVAPLGYNPYGGYGDIYPVVGESRDGGSGRVDRGSIEVG